MVGKEDVLKKCILCEEQYHAMALNQQVCKACKPIVHRLRNVFQMMRIRCKTNRNYAHCTLGWDTPSDFGRWAMRNGYKLGLHIDRINPYLGYYESNCRWITQAQNNRNKRQHNTDWDRMLRMCNMCYQWFPIERFSKNRKLNLGHAYSCKPCMIEYAQNYRRRQHE